MAKFDYSKRPISWSCLSSFWYNPEQWYQKYVKGIQEKPNAEMLFGKKVGERLASDPTYLPFVPRLDKYEQKFEVVYAKVPLIGYGDSFCTVTQRKLKEYKTGVKEWTQKRADEHGQIDMYLFMHFLATKIRPEEMECELVWLPTQKHEDKNFKATISFVEPLEKNFKIFRTKRTMADILRFAKKLRITVEEMKLYAKNHQN